MVELVVCYLHRECPRRELGGEQLAEAAHGADAAGQDVEQRQELVDGEREVLGEPDGWPQRLHRLLLLPPGSPRRGGVAAEHAALAAADGRARREPARHVHAVPPPLRRRHVRRRRRHAAPAGHVAAAARRGRGDVGDQEVAVLVIVADLQGEEVFLVVVVVVVVVVSGELEGEVLAAGVGCLERAEGEDDVVDVEHPSLPLPDALRLLLP
ncbi:hypothetical protein EE612_039537 [Oryza sativa]|nr:hypothetical protein EE612_039537 [Oryza sativa]